MAKQAILAPHATGGSWTSRGRHIQIGTHRPGREAFSMISESHVSPLMLRELFPSARFTGTRDIAVSSICSEVARCQQLFSCGTKWRRRCGATPSGTASNIRGRSGSCATNYFRHMWAWGPMPHSMQCRQRRRYALLDGLRQNIPTVWNRRPLRKRALPPRSDAEGSSHGAPQSTAVAATTTMKHGDVRSIGERAAVQ